MVKRFLPLLLLPLLLLGCRPSVSSSPTYHLRVEDRYDFLVEDIEGEYKPGERVTFELSADRLDRPGALLNGEIEVEQTVKEGEEGYFFAFAMPDEPSLLQITSGGLFGPDCGLGHHLFGEGYIDSRSERMAWRCLNCGYRTFDEKEAADAYRFGIEIYGANKVFEYGKEQTAELTLGEEYQLRINFPILDYREDIDQDIVINADASVSVYHAYNIDSQFAAIYRLVPLTFGSAGMQMQINDQTYDLSLEVNDASSDSIGKPSSIAELAVYSEFKTTIDSLAYYEYDPSLFVGLTLDDGRMGYGNESIDVFVDGDTYDTSYLSHLSDSVYYPAYFPYVEANPISDYRFEVAFDSVTASEAGSPAKQLASYGLYYSTLDPDHSGAKDPFDSLSFACVNLDYQPVNENFLEQLNNIRQDGTVVLHQTHPEYFFEYQVEELTLSVYTGVSSIGAIFEFGDYLYVIRATYVDR